MEILKVSSKSNPSKVAGAIANVFREEGSVEIQTIGAGSLIGWRADKDMCDIHYDTEMDDNGAPFVVLYYRNRPEPLYSQY